MFDHTYVFLHECFSSNIFYHLFIYLLCLGGGGRVVLQHVEMDVLDIYVVLYDIGI